MLRSASNQGFASLARPHQGDGPISSLRHLSIGTEQYDGNLAGDLLENLAMEIEAVVETILRWAEMQYRCACQRQNSTWQGTTESSRERWLTGIQCNQH